MKFSIYFTYIFRITLAVLIVLGIAVYCSQGSEAAEVYPIPHKVEKKEGLVVFKTLAPELVGIEEDEITFLKEHFTLDEQGLTLELSIKNATANAGLSEDMPEKEGAYVLSITPEKIIITGHDDSGVFYGLQTLIQLAVKKDSVTELPIVTITDWPDVPFRGTVEGFYGKPWGYEDRISQFEFYGRYKLNTYIYGPKDDPYHGFSTQWRDPYPEDQAEKIKELIKAAHRNKVNFVWAVHPGRDITWGEADQEAAIRKFQMMYDLGVRSFGVFFDDIGGEGAKAAGQVRFLNHLNREFIRKKPDVTPLIMCPTQYNKAWAGGDYLDILGNELDKDISIMWTGNSVVHDIAREDLQWINSRIKRPAFIWWNFPVSDYVRSMLLLGRIYGLEKDTQEELGGFVSNPMDKPEASKIALFSVADFTWNQAAFDSDTSWREGIKRLFPEYAGAMQTLADHNSDPGPNTHGYRREESVSVQPLVAAVLAGLKKDVKLSKIPESSALREEFSKIASAPDIIRSKSSNEALLREIEPWLISFEALGRAGEKTLDLITALDRGDTKEAFHAAMESNHIVESMTESSEAYARKINEETGDRWQKSIKTGSLVIKPSIDEMRSLGMAKLYSLLSGLPLDVRRPYISGSNIDGIEKMLDDDPSSFLYIQEIQKKGDFVGLDLGGVQEIRNVYLVMGRNDGDHDAIHKGQLEISKDGENWENLMPASSGIRISYEGTGRKGQFVRYRALEAGVPGGKPDVWTAVRDFRVNSLPPYSVATNAENLKNLVISANTASIFIQPVLEVKTLAPGRYVGLDLPSAPYIESVHINPDADQLDWANVEYTEDGRKWTALEMEKKDKVYISGLKKTIKGLRLSNKTSTPRDIKISEFRLKYPEDNRMAAGYATDGNLATSFDVELGSSPISIPVSPDQSLSRRVLVVSKGAGADLMVRASRSDWKKAGEIPASEKGDITSINLNGFKGSIEAVGLKGQEGATIRVYEIIFYPANHKADRKDFSQKEAWLISCKKK